MSDWAVHVDLPWLLTRDVVENAVDALDALVVDGGCIGPRQPTYATTEIYFSVDAEDTSAAREEGERLARAILERAGLAMDFVVEVHPFPPSSDRPADRVVTSKGP